MAYWYWCAACPTCRAIQVFGYLGSEADLPDGPGSPAISLPVPTLMTCKSCGVVHDYGVEEIKPRKLQQAPPSISRKRL